MDYELNTRKLNNYINKNNKETLLENPDITENDDKLFYKNKYEIVFSSDKIKVLNKLYVEYNFNSIIPFYKYVKDKYLGITRDDIKQYLLSNSNYQISRIPKKIKVETTKYNKPFICWSIDLIDMNYFLKSNRGFRYILDCIDLNSRYCWIRAIKNKNIKDITQAMKSIFNEAGNKPKIIKSDQGTEFNFNLGITHIRTSSYEPEPNIENNNRTIRNIINQYFIKNQNHIWYNILNKVQETKNNMYNESLKMSSQKYMDLYSNNEIVIKSKKEIKRKEPLEIGDYVRIVLSAFLTDYRKTIKNGDKKLIPVHYAPLLCRIVKIFKRSNGLNYYGVENLNGDVINDEKGKMRRFKQNELLKVNYDENITKDFNDEFIKKLNKFNVDK